MFPVVFTIPFLGIDVPGYGLMLMLGFFGAIFWATHRARRSGADPETIVNCGFIALIAGVVGCRIMYVIHYWDQFRYRGSLLDILIAIIDVRKGGMEFYGGFILATLLVPVWLRFVEKVSFRWYMDIIAPSAALGLAIGRIGCYLNGCCHGAICEAPWAVQFPFGSPAMVEHWQAKAPGAGVRQELLMMMPNGIGAPLPREILRLSGVELDAAATRLAENERTLRELLGKVAAASDANAKRLGERELNRVRAKLNLDQARYGQSVENMKTYGLSGEQLLALARQSHSRPVHPAQWYSTITAGLVALFLNALYYRRSRDGQVILTLLLIEPPTRFVLEFIRTDNPPDQILGMTVSQVLALSMSLLALLALFGLRWMPVRSPRAKLFVPPPAVKSAAAQPSQAKAARN